MNILVVGGGGREHALIWRLKKSPRVKKIYCAPGNGGIAQDVEVVPIAADDLSALLQFSKREKIDLCLVGPELPLTLGIADLFEKERIPLFGPRREAARLEGSKVFTKQILREFSVPTARFEVFSDHDRAVDFLNTQAYPLVIKVDGLAAGKGVLVCKDRQAATAGLRSIFKEKSFGEAGHQVVIEEFLAGREVSFQAFVDGESLLPMDSVQDHKRVGDRDTGPNTGGMGAFSPATFLTEALQAQVIEEILKPTLRGLRQRGILFKGVLYAGLMLTPSGPKLLEYNVRFGDPECQSLVVRMEDDLVDLIEATLSGQLSGRRMHWSARSSVCVVMAAHGYPEDPQKGDQISGLELASLPETVIFHAGTRREKEKLVTHGGRVLGVTSLGKDLRQAMERAYDACEKIYWRGVHYRHDIGGG